jgi:hypothetical protein
VKDRLIDPFDPSFEPIEIELGPNGELPPGYREYSPGEGFRLFLAENGEDRPSPDCEPAGWVAWYLDARWVDDVEVYDVNDGPVEDEWPTAR